MSFEPQNNENKEKEGLLSMENYISEKAEKLRKKKMSAQCEINATSVSQRIPSTSATSSHVK